MHAVRKVVGHSGSFKVILIGVGGNPEWSVDVRYINVDLISETYEDIAINEKTANSSISNTPLWFNDSCPRKAFE